MYMKPEPNGPSATPDIGFVPTDAQEWERK